MNDRDRRRLPLISPPSEEDDPVDDQGIEEISVIDKDVEDRIADFIAQDKTENAVPAATLYKFTEETGEKKEQVNYFKGLIPSRHEIGLMYGAGRYLLVLTVKVKGMPPRSTSYRFPLHKSYDAMKQRFDEEEARKNSPALPPYALQRADGDKSFKDALLVAQAMMKDTMAMFAPVIQRAINPPVVAPQDNSIKDSLGVFGSLRQILRENATADMNFYQHAKRSMFNMRPEDIEGEFDQAAPEEKKSIVDRLLTLAEPFIPLLIQNNTASRLATAGVRAIPQVNGIVKQVTARPDALKLAAEIIEKKYGKQEAINLLRNFGVKTESIIPAVPAAPINRKPIKRIILKKKH